MIAMPVTRDSLMAELACFVADQTGLHFPQSAWRDLERGMASAASELGMPDAQAVIRWLLTPPITSQHIQTLAQHLTVGETYFFREKPALDALEKRILPELINARRSTTRRLRIWSAACCTGEEPYTIAIILSRLLPDWKDWDITILGTDINTHFLKLAAEGVYRNWSFRATPPEIKERYFTATPDGYALNPEIKRMVTFSYLNLADAPYASHLEKTSNIDVIFCRNALMYFSAEGVTRTIGNFHNALAEGGWLIVNPSEATPSLFAQYEVVAQPDVMLFRKGNPNELRSAERGIWNVGYEPQSTPPTFVFPTQYPIIVGGAPYSPPVAWEVALPQLPIEKPSPAAIPEGKATPDASKQSAGPGATDWDAIRTLQEQGRHLEARDKLLALIGQGSSDARVFAMLAGIEANLGRLTAALEWSEQATLADRMNPAYWYLRATVLQEQGALDEAIAALKRVLYLDSGFVLAHFVLGNMMLQQGRKPQALKHFSTARSQLSTYRQDVILAGSEDLTAGQLDALIASMLN